MIADVIVFWREGLKTITSQKEVEDEFALKNRHNKLHLFQKDSIDRNLFWCNELFT
jgi:hypothetical protein